MNGSPPRRHTVDEPFAAFEFDIYPLGSFDRVTGQRIDCRGVGVPQMFGIEREIHIHRYVNKKVRDNHGNAALSRNWILQMGRTIVSRPAHSPFFCDRFGQIARDTAHVISRERHDSRHCGSCSSKYRFVEFLSGIITNCPFFKDLSAISLRTQPIFTHRPMLQNVE